ncbi:hypothetical protein [Nocardia sp. NPDC051833]|uniref:hypothetical protein n=1 Tax=Nocardia sp. NPDC051833 TaxID=3155674 RepID=UPI0034392BA6
MPYITGSLAQLELAPAIPLGAVDRDLAAVWRTQPFAAGGVLSGRPRIDLTVVPASTDLTLIGILYDEGSARPPRWPRT